MATLMQMYLQSVTINGGEVNRQDIFEASYLEVMDFDGPVLMLKLRDSTNYYTDNLKVMFDATIVASLGDPGGQSLFQETFSIVQAPLHGDFIEIVAISQAVRQLLTPTVQPQYFVDSSPSDVVRRLGSGLRTDLDGLNTSGTWHLNNGMKPAVLLKQIARDAGARAWATRGTLKMKLVASMLSAAPSYTYEMNNPKATFTINKWRWINTDHAAQAKHSHQFMSYDEQKGFVSMGADGLPVRLISNPDLGVLQGQALGLLPKLDAEVGGNPGIAVGMTIKVVINRYDKESRENESIPSVMVVERVCQYEGRFNHLTRMILAVPNQSNSSGLMSGQTSSFK